jgi:predicted transcriptional regulator
MALTLDDSQLALVDTRRKPSGTRPKYYNSSQDKTVEISEDFEAFLILQGKKRNSDTLKWLDSAKTLAARNLSRDALASQALKRDVEDASNSQHELQALINSFNSFRESYQTNGFENVVEAGILLQDLQVAMAEIQTVVNRLKHRELSGKFGLTDLTTNGISPKRQQQISSWYSPLCAY